MMTVILVESHIAKNVKVLRFQVLHAFFFGDEHSLKYQKAFYTIMKANSHSETFQLFLLLIQRLY